VILVLALAIGYNYRETLLLTLLINAPSLFITPIVQEIGFVTAPDGVRIAYATTGQGPPIIQILGFGTHIENGFQSPLYDSAGTIAMTSRDHLYVRYDGRGFGLSDRDVDDFSLQARVSDLESVVDALGLESFDLLAASAGGSVGIEYTVRHPERVTRLVLAGTYASSNWLDNVKRESWERMWDLFDVDWQNPVVSEMLASLLLSPGGGDLDRRLIGQLLRRSAEGETATRFFRTIYSEDTTEQAKRINVPTLILQGTDDAITDVGAGRELASLIPGSQIEFVEGGHLAASGMSPAIRRRILDFFEDK